MPEPGPPAFDNLAVCNEHGVMLHTREEGRRRCPLCHLDMDVEVCRDAGLPEDATGSTSLSGTEIAQRIPAEMMEELLPLMAAYLEDQQGEDYTMYVTVGGCPKDDLPAGYTAAQERWANAVVYHFGGREKAITSVPPARSTIETLREEGYGDA